MKRKPIKLQSREEHRPLSNPEIEYILFAHEFFSAKAIAAELRVSDQAVYRIIREARSRVIDLKYELKIFLKSLTKDYVRFKVFQECHTDLAERSYNPGKEAA